MKTISDIPLLINGYIIPNRDVKWGNTPIIKLSDVIGVVYYTDEKYIIRFHTANSNINLEWCYDSKDSLIQNYSYICDNFLFNNNIYGTFEEIKSTLSKVML